MNSFSFEAIGTQWQIDVISDVSAIQLETLQKQIQARIAVYDKTYSRFRNDSLISEIASKAGTYIFPADAKELFAIYKKLYDLTDGLFTPLVGDLLSQAGYDSTYSLKTKIMHQPPKWEQTMRFKNGTLISKKPVTLDFGAGGKGYLIDSLGEILEKNNVTSFCIDGSGDFLYKDSNFEPLRIGLENPQNTKEVIGVANLSQGSLCGSAGNRRAWGEFHHIINPNTLTSPKDILAVWVIAPTGLLADCLSTCLFFVPPEKLLPHFSFSYGMINSNMQLTKSAEFPAEFFYH